jgi:putative redox protein
MADRLEVTAVWRGGLATDVSAGEHTVRVDEPESAGGADTGPMPTEMFLISLASCFCIAVAWVARKHRREVPGLRVVVRARRPGTELRYEGFEVDTQAELDDETLAWLVAKARPLCWVSNTLAAGVAVEYGHTQLNGRFRK